MSDPRSLPELFAEAHAACPQWTAANPCRVGDSCWKIHAALDAIAERQGYGYGTCGCADCLALRASCRGKRGKVGDGE